MDMVIDALRCYFVCFVVACTLMQLFLEDPLGVCLREIGEVLCRALWGGESMCPPGEGALPREVRRGLRHCVGGGVPEGR